MRGHAALGRPGTMQEVAAAVRLLCNPRNTYMTGQIVLVDGGWSTGYGRNF
jgi:NAD(P)-dependent dehydrogenase (short-subunit alcohol dehydrogenase family)